MILLAEMEWEYENMILFQYGKSCFAYHSCVKLMEPARAKSIAAAFPTVLSARKILLSQPLFLWRSAWERCLFVCWYTLCCLYITRRCNPLVPSFLASCKSPLIFLLPFRFQSGSKSFKNSSNSIDYLLVRTKRKRKNSYPFAFFGLLFPKSKRGLFIFCLDYRRSGTGQGLASPFPMQIRW